MTASFQEPVRAVPARCQPLLPLHRPHNWAPVIDTFGKEISLVPNILVLIVDAVHSHTSFFEHTHSAFAQTHVPGLK